VISGRTRRRSRPPWICIERLLHLLPDRGGVQWCLPLAFAGEEHNGDVTADRLCLLVWRYPPPPSLPIPRSSWAMNHLPFLLAIPCLCTPLFIADSLWKIMLYYLRYYNVSFTFWNNFMSYRGSALKFESNSCHCCNLYYCFFKKLLFISRLMVPYSAQVQSQKLDIGVEAKN
jgi:hypothetical protein